MGQYSASQKSYLITSSFSHSALPSKIHGLEIYGCGYNTYSMTEEAERKGGRNSGKRREGRREEGWREFNGGKVKREREGGRWRRIYVEWWKQRRKLWNRFEKGKRNERERK